MENTKALRGGAIRRRQAGQDGEGLTAAGGCTGRCRWTLLCRARTAGADHGSIIALEAPLGARHIMQFGMWSAPVRIETASGSEPERRTRAMLETLLAANDTSRWQFTDRVVIDETAIGHSHPVLTLGTKFPVRTRIGVLSAFLHEQVHWYLVARREACSAAIQDLRSKYPHVPRYQDGGARDESSTYLHLIVNWLELESLRSVVGRQAADETLQEACRAPVAYHWIYRRVFQDHAAIGEVVLTHGLDDALNAGDRPERDAGDCW